MCVLGGTDATGKGEVVTGSAGKQAGGRIVGFKLRRWLGGQTAAEAEQHKNGIRELCPLAADLGGARCFASCSNDSTVRVWSLAGQGLEQLRCIDTGADCFLYSLCSLPRPEGEAGGPLLAVACDDNCVRVFVS